MYEHNNSIRFCCLDFARTPQEVLNYKRRHQDGQGFIKDCSSKKAKFSYNSNRWRRRRHREILSVGMQLLKW